MTTVRIADSPSLLGWILSVVSLGACASVLFGILAVSERLRGSLVSERLINTIRSGDRLEAERYLLARRATPRWLKAFAPQIAERLGGESRRDGWRQRLLEVTLDAEYALGADRPILLDSALDRMESLSEQGVELPVPRLKDLAAEFKRNRAEREKMRLEWSTLDAQSPALIQRYTMLAKDLSDLVGLSPEVKDPSIATLPTYSAGVLRGMPRLERLPDNLVDLVELRAALTHAGGSVRVVGPDAHAQFTNMIQRLGASGTSLGESLFVQRAALARVENRVRQLDQDVELVRGKLKNRFLNLVERALGRGAAGPGR